MYVGVELFMTPLLSLCEKGCLAYMSSYACSGDSAGLTHGAFHDVQIYVRHANLM